MYETHEERYSQEELAQRIWAVEQVKKLAAKRFYYQAAERRAEELDELWVREPDHQAGASLGSNWGYYTGMDQIRAYYVTAHDARRRAHLEALHDADPSIEVKPENLDLGCMHLEPISTALVELAGDGQTAKGLWYSIGQRTTSRPDGTAEALWITTKIGIDFILEGQEFRIWHVIYAVDFSHRAGTSYADQPVYLAEGEDPVRVEFGTPTIPMLTHNDVFSWADGYPPEPEPYETFTDALSYGPEGYPKQETEGHPWVRI